MSLLRALARLDEVKDAYDAKMEEWNEAIRNCGKGARWPECPSDEEVRYAKADAKYELLRLLGDN